MGRKPKVEKGEYVGYEAELETSLDFFRQARANKEVFDNEQLMLELMKARYEMCWQQIHKELAPLKTVVSENKIQSLIKDIFSVDLGICESKISRFKNAVDSYTKRKEEAKIELAYQYLQEWLTLYEGFYALVAFRHLEYFALFMEWEKRESEKVWAPSLDPYGDGGYTGVSKPFFFYFNQMVLKKNIKFISKQMFTGGGKCVDPKTMVMTPIGSKMIKDLNVGDFVYSMKDNELCERRVLNKWNTRKKQIKITTRGGVSVITSPEHKLYTQRGYVQAQHIKQSDYLYRLCKKYEPKNPVVVNDDELVFVSCMLFDGHCKAPNYNFSKMPNTEITKSFTMACDNLGIRYSKVKKYGTDCIMYDIWQNGHISNEIMQRYELEGKLSKEKRLPKQFFDMNLTQKYKFLGLMFATDGYIADRDTGITTASKDLAQDLMEFLDTCGIYSCVTYKKSKCEGKYYDAWRVTIPSEYLTPIFENCYCYDKQKTLLDVYASLNGKAYCNNTNYPKELFDGRKDFRQRVKTSWGRNKTFKRSIVEDFNKRTNSLSDIVYKDFVWEQIKSIEFDDTEVDMVDIEVEETHNFIANHIVSHNSYSNQFAIAWLFGIDKNNDVLDVLGNPTLVLTNTKGVVEIMTNSRYAKVFPEYQKFFDMEGDIKSNMFSICRMKEGELTLMDSSKTLNLKVISKQTSIDGIRVRYLFLDDVCKSIDANNLKQHQIDIDNFWNSWWKRNYGTDDFYIIACGTAYSVNDILSHLISYYSKGKMKRTKINKYTYENMDGNCIFIKIPKIDDDYDRSTYPQKFPYEEAIRIKERNLASFLAMEQQQPQNPETSPLCYDKLNTYERLPDNISENAYACLDPARTGKNYVTMGIHRTAKEKDKFGVDIERHYLVDCVFQLKQMEDVYGEICDKIQHHHIIRLHIENNTDTSLKFLLEKMLHERGIMFCEISESFSSENKEEKMREMVYGMEGYFKNQMVYPAMNMYAPSSQMGKFMLYFTAYDYYKPVEYDDSIDEECMYIDAFVAKKRQLAKAKLLHL